MDSEKFFQDKGSVGDLTAKSWKGKQGIYVIEQPLLNQFYNNKPVFKVGYARDILYTRLRNYKTAYARAPFKIHCIMQTASGAKNLKGNVAHLTEKSIHEELDKLNLAADKKGENDDGTRSSEWFYNLDEILRIITTIRTNLQNTVTFSEKNLFYINPKYEHLGRTRSQAAKIGNIEDTKSTLPVATYRQSTRKPKGNLTVGGNQFKDAFEEEPNPSKKKQKNVPTYLKYKLT